MATVAFETVTPELAVQYLKLNKSNRPFRKSVGERYLRDILDMFKRKKIPFMQIDMLWFWQDCWNSAEVKAQSRYVNPDGHGMPLWQVKSRLELYNATGIVPWLFVVEKDTGQIFYQRINVLEDKGRLTVTEKNKRVVWPIEHFIPIRTQP